MGDTRKSMVPKNGTFKKSGRLKSALIPKSRTIIKIQTIGTEALKKGIINFETTLYIFFSLSLIIIDYLLLTVCYMLRCN